MRSKFQRKGRRPWSQHTLLAAALSLFACRKGATTPVTTPASSSPPVASAASVPEPTLEKGTISSGGHERTFLFMAHVSKDALPLVIGLHGRLGDGAGQDKLTHVSTLAKRERFHLALPDGYDKSWNDARGVTPAAAAHYDDVLFVSELVDWFVKEHHADPSRVYVMGMSNGGFMTLTLACRLADKIAAFAAVCATLSVGLECKPSVPVSGMIIAGEDDKLVPYHGGLMDNGARGRNVSAPASISAWAKIDGCKKSTTGKIPDAAKDDTDASLIGWTDCDGGAELELVTVHGGGHTWPGGMQYLPEMIIGKTSRDFDATERIWNFFKTKKR